jgi:hypothetical protein
MSSNSYYLSNERSCLVAFNTDATANINASFNRWLYGLNLYELIDDIGIEDRSDDYSKTGYCMPTDWKHSLIDTMRSYPTIEEIAVFLGETGDEDELLNSFYETLDNIIVINEDLVEVGETEYRVCFVA